MYAFGGYNGSKRLNDMYEYNFSNNRWDCIEKRGDCPSGRSSLVAEVHGNSLFIFGGYNGQVVLNDFYEFSFETLSIPPPALIGDLRKLIDNNEYSDVVFVVEDRPVYATRAHLAVRSEHFRAMLFGGMRESASKEIVIPDVSHAVFMLILEFLYVLSVLSPLYIMC